MESSPNADAPGVTDNDIGGRHPVTGCHVVVLDWSAYPIQVKRQSTNRPEICTSDDERRLCEFVTACCEPNAKSTSYLKHTNSRCKTIVVAGA